MSVRSVGRQHTLWHLDDGIVGLLEGEVVHSVLSAEIASLRAAESALPLRGLVVRLEEVVRSRKTLYLVMHEVPGQELFQVVANRGAVPEALARRLLCQLLQALAGLHRLGVTHRDVKLPNVLMTDTWPPEVRLGDRVRMPHRDSVCEGPVRPFSGTCQRENVKVNGLEPH